MAYDDRLHLSASQLSTFSRCPQLYKIEKIDKVRSPPSAALIKGNAVHNTLEQWERGGRSFDVEADYRLIWRAELDDALRAHPDLTTWNHGYGVRDAESDLRLRERDGLWEVQQYISLAEAEAGLWKVAKLNGDLAIEIPFKIDFTDFVVTGRIDAVQQWHSTNAITVVDYKTGSRKDEAYRQLGTYKVGLEELYGIPVTHGRYFYTKKNIKTQLMTGSSEWIDLTRYTKDYLREQYATLKRARENNIYLAAPSRDKCGMCSVKKLCPEMSGR